ncbi:MAG: hypothetical protein E7364_04550 [Clostridiales bacterium]|nr:hypothetical protein [Clostridiales bacterium]
MKKKKKIIVAAMIAAISSLAFGAVGVFANAASKETEKTKINYEIAPEIMVDFPNGFDNELPNAALDKSYAIPSATAIDVYGDELMVHTAVYAHYYSETRSLIQIENNAFLPAFYGIYTICYTATDDFGNAAMQTFDITCEEKQPLTAIVEEVSEEYFVGREVKVANISVENQIGEVEVQIIASCAYASYAVENGVFFPEYAGEYTIEYVYSDYNETNKVSYTINVQENETPVFTSEVTLPEYFILGASYSLPQAECMAYSGNGIYSISPSISVRYLDKNYTLAITNGEFTPQIAGEVKIVYEANALGKVERREYSATVVDVNFNGAMTMQNYFYGEDIGLNAQSYGVEISTLTDGASASFINSVLSRTLTMTLGIDADKNAFNSLDIYLTDVQDKSKEVKISFQKTGTDAKVVVNDDDYAYGNVAFDEASTFMFEYSNATRTVSMAGSDKIAVKKTLSGEAFDGFGEFITVKYVFSGVTGYSTFFVYSIDNQTFSDEKGDGMRPHIIFSAYAGGEKEVGDLIEIERIYVADILDPNCTVNYYVFAPSGKYVVSTDGELLNRDTDYTKSYSFLATENGKYVVYMEIEDSVGNGEIYAYSINVIDTQAPAITLSGVKTEVKAGSSITLATAAVSDNRTPTGEMKVFVVLICPDWTTVMAENGKAYKPDQYGTYTVWYYVTDGDGNIAMESYQFTVK